MPVDAGANEAIQFFEESTALPDYFDAEAVIPWMHGIADRYDKTIGMLSVIFCSDDYLLEINKEYLQHDYYTDIITFPYREDDVIEADLFISIDRIAENAGQLDVPQREELLRVLIHGLLHLCGLGDKSEEEVKRMREAEDEALAIFPTLPK